MTAKASARRWARLAPPLRMPLIACAIALGAWAACAVPVRADAIDYELYSKAHKVMRYLRAHGYQNVAVLKFRVKQGGKEVFNRGPINTNMATRLENALVAINPEEKPLGFIRDAGKVIAAQKQHISYLTPTGRDKLFRLKYPLLWGNRWVKADAFLTGAVMLTPNQRQTKVIIEVIDRQTKQRQEVLNFLVKTDRTILTDLRQNFALNRRKIRRMGPDDKNDEAVNDANRRTNDPEQKARPTNGLVQLVIKYDDQEQDVTDHTTREKEYQVNEPRDVKEVVLEITNVSDQRVAVVLAVNGLNTLYQENVEEKSPAGCSKWVLKPHATYKIRGFYEQGDTRYKPFRILSEEESKTQEENAPNAKLGAIQLIVFTEGDSNAGQEKVNQQGLRKSLSKLKKRPRTAREARALVRKFKQQGLIGLNEASRDVNLNTVTFKNPEQVEDRTIWYRDRSGTDLNGGGA